MHLSAISMLSLIHIFHLLRLQERELFAESLAAYARKISNVAEQRVKATMDGLVNGTTTL